MLSAEDSLQGAPSTLLRAAEQTDPETARELRALADLLTKPRWLTSKEAADLLGVSSRNTIKNWLQEGHFPRSRRTPGGHYRFLLADVLQVKEAMQELSDRNARQDLAVPVSDHEPEDFPVF